METIALENWAENIIAPKLSKVNRLFSVALNDKYSTQIEDLRERVMFFYRECRSIEDFTVVLGIIRVTPTNMKEEDLPILFQEELKERFKSFLLDKELAEKLVNESFVIEKFMTKVTFRFKDESEIVANRKVLLRLDKATIEGKHLNEMLTELKKELDNIKSIADRISADLVADM